MGDSYAEAGVKQKETLKTMVIKVALIVGAVGFFLFSFRSSFMLIFGTLCIVGMFYLFPRLSTEYEYIFCDGQIDFDKIMGSDKRKTVLKIDLENVEVAAPAGSHAFDNYNQTNNLKVKDFTSRDKEIKPFVLILHEGDHMLKILFEPSERMIQCMKNKAPRKVITY